MVADGWVVEPREVPAELTADYVAEPFTNLEPNERPICRNCGETIRTYGTGWEHLTTGERRCVSLTSAEPEETLEPHITGWASFGELLGAEGVRRLFGAIQ